MTSADLHPSTHLRASAWVPDDVEDRPYEDAIALAADWIWERSQDEDSAPLLVSNAQNAASFGYADLDEIIRAGGHATPQSRSRPDRGPVLAFVPDERSLHFAWASPEVIHSPSSRAPHPWPNGLPVQPPSSC